MAAGDLCTRDEAKAWLKIANADSDALIDALITRCSAGITRWVSRPLLTATYTAEKYNGSGTSRLTLKNYPVTAVAAVTVNGVTVPAASGPTEYGFMFDQYGLYLTGVMGSPTPGSNIWLGSIFPAGNLNAAVTYTAGYALVPEDIRQACIEFVSYKYLQRAHIGKKTENINVGGMGTSYQEGLLPPEVQDLLQTYRKVVPV